MENVLKGLWSGNAQHFHSGHFWFKFPPFYRLSLFL